MHGVVTGGYLIKRGKQVQKFWKYDGYAISERDLNSITNGVILYTEYDGVLYNSKDEILKNGIVHDYEGEKQYVLPLKHWRVRDAEGNDKGSTSNA